MADRPILFSTPMVRAILAGTKTQTRRAVKHPAIKELSYVVDCGDGWWGDEEGDVQARCPHGQPGDRLWVREAWRTSKVADELRPSQLVGDGFSPIHYEAQDDVPFHQSDFGKLRPSMFMPRWASRITLEVTSVRVERLQDINEADALAEGIEPFTDWLPSGHWKRYADGGENAYVDNPIASYASLWTEINGPSSWEANPWVWIVEFKQLAATS